MTLIIYKITRSKWSWLPALILGIIAGIAISNYQESTGLIFFVSCFLTIALFPLRGKIFSETTEIFLLSAYSHHLFIKNQYKGK